MCSGLVSMGLSLEARRSRAPLMIPASTALYWLWPTHKRIFMQVSTMGLVATGEGILGSPEVRLPGNYQAVDNPWAARQAVREQIHYGADWIKFHSTSDYEFEPNGEL